LTLVTPFGLLLQQELPREAVVSTESPDGSTHDFQLPAALVDANTVDLSGRRPLGWCIEALGTDGVPVAGTGLQLFSLEK
ncbi:MAG: hypothetical protein KDB18_06240, partial [Salinibacterium sp.]|nr:hypothetical protein [Salinibacterium sp.]